MTFSPKTYWEDRLVGKYSLEGVGDITLGKYNLYLYKVRKWVFKRIVNKYLSEVKLKSVADVGSGTGFYIDLWNKIGAGKITGFDISQYAVEKLSVKYSDEKFAFKTKDISDICLPEERFDIISAFDIFCFKCELFI
jgi:ubiquinone/menaquinone biosynthesis C-methylase UbiE